MDGWLLLSITLLTTLIETTINSDVMKYCRKRTSKLNGEELICTKANQDLFNTFNLILDKTHWLTCENCTLNVINENTFINLSKNNINYLYLIDNNITKIRSLTFLKFPNLKVLNLQKNPIGDIQPGGFFNLRKLQQLDLSTNQLTILFNNLFLELENLDVLNLNSNKIFYIQPNAFDGLINLKYLYLNWNNLEKLDNYIFKPLTNLLILYLENNNIVQINSFAFHNLNNLNLLYLNNNNLTYLLPYNFKPLINLIDLQLRNNSLIEIQTSSFNGMRNLKFLYLGNNKLAKIQPYGLIGLDNLQILELINNEFIVFNFDAIQNLINLKLLWLETNQITNLLIDYKFEPLLKLNVISLNANNFTSFNYKLFYNKLPNIKDIYIVNNTWKCEFLINMFNFMYHNDVNLCVNSLCNQNHTKNYIEDICLLQRINQKKDRDKNDNSSYNNNNNHDFVTENSISIKSDYFIVFLSLFFVNFFV